MEFLIKDGTGGGYEAKVDSNNRVHALAVSSSISQAAGVSGDTFNFNTDVISLTTANKSAVAYIKNNSINDIYIDPVGFLLGNSTGGTGNLRLEIIKNPTQGTIIDNAADVPILENKNAGSSKQLDALTYKGAEGDTIGNGSLWYATLLPSAATVYTIGTGSLILKGGNSLGINVVPQLSNTAMDVMIFMSVIEANGSIT